MWPEAASAGSRNPGRESGESGRADAGGTSPDQAISRPRRLEYALSPEGLYEAAQRCFKGTDWKASVAAFELNCWERCLDLSDELRSGTYRPRKPKRFMLTRPKRRECCSICIRDRVFQRSLNDNVIYPVMTRGLIKENCACQKGKGTDYARDLFERQLKRWWHHHGTSGYVLNVDISGYYPNMRHDVALGCLRRHLEPEEFAWAERILTSQYSGDVGFEPGSQLVQIVGISVLSPLDHFIKERLRIREYLRYMDDMKAILATREDADAARDAIGGELAKIGFEFNPKKTCIQRIDQRIPFLGFTFELKESGKVVRRVEPEKARDQRRRIRRLVEAERAGKVPPGTADKSFGTTYRYLLGNCSGRDGPEKYRRYYESLRKEL